MAGAFISVAAAQGTCNNMTVLSWAHFIKASDTDLQNVLNDFGKQNNINVRLDTVSLNDVPSKMAAAVQSQSGPDVMLLMNYSTALYANQMISIDDVVSTIEKNYSEFLPIGQEASKINGTWRSVPWFYTPAPANYRADYFEQAGVTPPDTWAQLLQDAKALKAIGHPVGLGISNAGDSNDWLLASSPRTARIRSTPMATSPSIRPYPPGPGLPEGTRTVHASRCHGLGRWWQQHLHPFGTRILDHQPGQCLPGR